MRKFVFTIIIFLVLIFLYGKYIESDKIKIHEYVISNDLISEHYKELKFVHISDILYNGNQKRLDKILSMINSLKPDVLFFTGDLFNKNYSYKDEDYENIKSFLNNIDVELYKYAVVGDNDINYFDKYNDLLYESDFILLNNEKFLLFYKDNTPVNIIGLNTLDDYNIEDLLEQEIDYNYSIVLVHKPDEIINLDNDRINLVLAGHSLGGIINIPYNGGLIKKDGAKTYVNNYYKVNNTFLYVSNGLGYEKFEFRLNNTPSINVYRFQ